MEANWIRLPLENAYNVRELGGIPAAGGMTAWKQFLRADDMDTLSEEDILFLQEYGVRTVLDLRSAKERSEKPDLLADEAWIHYHVAAFMEEDVSPARMAAEITDMTDLGSLYCRFLEKRDVVRSVFEIIADAPDGCVLFHCAGGKDRTGTTALLLLMLAGVDLQDCIANYMVTRAHLTRNPMAEKMAEMAAEYGVKNLEKLADSPAEAAEKVYHYITKDYGGIEQYLKLCGVQARTMAAVRERLVHKMTVVYVAARAM